MGFHGVRTHVGLSRLDLNGLKDLLIDAFEILHSQELGQRWFSTAACWDLKQEQASISAAHDNSLQQRLRCGSILEHQNLHKKSLPNL